jgi:parallel beta-helix repeat protein
MQGMHSHWAVQHRALTMQDVPRGLLGRLRRLGVAVICGITFPAVSAQADDDIVVPRDFPTIQAAVDAAPPGATIKVRPGTYTEEIVIAKDLTLQGVNTGKTIIKAPPTLTPFARRLNGEAVAAVVLITDAAHVRVSGFTVTGPIPCGASTGGIFVVKGATLKVSDARITTMHPEVGTCPPELVRGVGIGLGLPQFVEIDGQLGTTGHATITHVAIDRFQFFGIIVAGPSGGRPSTATISHNVITGATPFPSAQIGIDVRLASVARVNENTVRGMVCTDPFCGQDPINELLSAGISTTFAELPGTVIKGNTVVGNDVGIYLFGSEGCCETRENAARNNRFFGIVIQDGSNDTTKNEIRGGEVGIGVVADFVDTVAVLRDDEIKKTSVAPVKEISCCRFTATAIVEDN